MKNNKELAEIIEDSYEFSKLLKLLFKNDGKKKGYTFKQVGEYEAKNFRGEVIENYPGEICPVGFHFYWPRSRIANDDIIKKCRQRIEKVLNNAGTYKTVIFVWPYSSEGLEEKGIRFESKYKGINLKVYGYKEINRLLNSSPVLKQYYYGAGNRGDSSQMGRRIKKDYECRLSKDLEYLQLVGLPTGNYQKMQVLKKPQLSRVYIPPGFNEKKDVNRKKRFTLEHILKKHNRVLIMGGPGSGKSTLLKYISLIHLGKVKQKNRELLKRRTPFIISLREFNQRRIKSHSHYDFTDFLAYTLNTVHSQKQVDRFFLMALFKLGKSIVLFDGLDEVPQEENRSHLLELISSFADQFPDIDIWITSRIDGRAGVAETLTKSSFTPYYFGELLKKQTDEFIKNWYKIQESKDKSRQRLCINSLMQATEANPGVRRLRSNPLLLTMMTLVHQFEGTLPDNRAKLYEKCIELLMKTWQQHKEDAGYANLEMAKIGLKYDDQLRLLATVAREIQKTPYAAGTPNHRGQIEETKLKDILNRHYFIRNRTSLQKAMDDIQQFIDYIRYRTGLLVEVSPGIFAFVHLSFQEYLCAFHIVEDRNTTRMQHIAQLLEFIPHHDWEEVILLALQLFEKKGGPMFIDAFMETVLKKIKPSGKKDVCYLLGKAVRDNISFSQGDMEQIVDGIVEIYLNSLDGIAFSVLEDIVRFSFAGKGALRYILQKKITDQSTRRIFRGLTLYKKFFDIDDAIIMMIARNDSAGDFPAYLPIHRDSPLMRDYIAKNLGLGHWLLFFNSSSNKTVMALEGLINGNYSLPELKGQIFSTWHSIICHFNCRRLIEPPDGNSADASLGFYSHEYAMTCDFAGYAGVTLPLNSYGKLDVDLGETKKPAEITDRLFLMEDGRNNERPKDEILKEWMTGIARNTIESLEHNPNYPTLFSNTTKEELTEKMIKSGKDFLDDFLETDIHTQILDFLDYLEKGSSLDFIRRYFSKLKKKTTYQATAKQLISNFNRYFVRQMKTDGLFAFYREFPDYIDSDSLRSSVMRFLKDRLHHLDMLFKKDIQRLYRKYYKKKFPREGISDSDNERLCHLFVNPVTRGDRKFTSNFFHHLFEFFFYDKQGTIFMKKIPTSTFKSGREIQVQLSDSRITMLNPFLVPFTYAFLFFGLLDHYFLDILECLKFIFFEKEPSGMAEIKKAVALHCRNKPFHLYLVRFCWNDYAAGVNQHFRDIRRSDTSVLPDLIAGASITNAANVSLTTGMDCEGPEWNDFLKNIELSDNDSLFTAISQTLYELCNHRNMGGNSKRLEKLLGEFKEKYPSDYTLLGLPK